MDELHQAVERVEHCRATLLEARPVTVDYFEERFSRYIKTFKLDGHPSAKKAFAWMRGENPHPEEPEYTVVLAGNGIHSPEDALLFKLKEVSI
jgi:hypothetical protein